MLLFRQMNRICALERTGYFLASNGPNRTDGTAKGVAQLKNSLCAKNALRDQTCSGLERCAALS